MTEAEWLVSADPQAMRHVVSGGVGTLRAWRTASSRQLRLFGLACSMECGQGHQVLATRAAALLREIMGNPFRPVVLPKGPGRPCPTCEAVVRTVAQISGATLQGWECGECGSKERQGTAYGPCPWLTPTVLSLARAAYDGPCPETGHLDPFRLLLVADALEEAGCTDEAILAHLRSPGAVHVRGCWALDLILGKS